MITSEHRLGSVDSTMEAAKSLAASQDFLLVSAEAQTQGKGTRGRAWQSPPGNIYMTLGIHRRRLPPARLALLPLEIGLHLWEAAAAAVSPAQRGGLTLKWPNDLLLRGSKVAGILMESHGEFLLVGIGINVAGAPPVADGGAPSACLADAGMPADGKAALVEDLYRRVREAPSGTEGYDPETILLQWQGKVDWERSHRLRDRPGTPWVTPISVNRHGHLQVRHADGGREWLVAEYLV
ncbi:MAG TPA: biotin--[acetyl-CoA-carboxylase] ligase [Fibrobacteria bacterium]|nr:biotin--[acetyl-CoA-carboxylase] ligase [Fibrobacteria bacterium]